MSIISLTIDGKALRIAQGVTILQAAQEAGIYIPTLCAHPDLPPHGACGVCTVEAGPQLVLACETKAANGMVIQTNSERVKNIRQDKLSAMLLHHPHACLTCGQKVGCSRTQCTNNVAEKERCCQRLGNCEIERLVQYIGLRDDLGRYVYRDLPKFLEEPLFTRDYNLCIGCGRCLRACRDLRGVNALEAYTQEERLLVRAKAATLAESGCKFCTACVAVCPTGALMDKDEAARCLNRQLCLQIQEVPRPPDKWLVFNSAAIAQVPETEGVFQLLDANKNVIYIVGTVNLNKALKEHLENEEACYFSYEQHPMFTQRESQLLQQFLQEHGKLPKGNDELDDLF